MVYAVVVCLSVHLSKAGNDSHRGTKLKAPEMISHSRDMVGDQNLMIRVTGMVCHLWASTYYQ